MPTYSFDCCADARTPASPTMPIAMPAAMPLRPHARPAARCAKPVKAEYFGWLFTGKATAPPPRATNFQCPLLSVTQWQRRGGEARFERGVWGRERTLVSDNHGNDKAVDAKHTRHHNGDDRLHDQVRLHDAHRGHANARLGGAIGGTQVCARGAARGGRPGADRNPARRRRHAGRRAGEEGGATHSRRSARLQLP